MVSSAGFGGWRRCALWWHRWVGLTLTLFLVGAGTTGAVLAFYEPLDAWLFPQLYRLPEEEGLGKALDPLTLRQRLLRQLPAGAQVFTVPLSLAPGSAARFWVEGDGIDDEYAVHPATGLVLASRRWGDLGQGLRRNLLPFVYRLHSSLALGSFGEWLLGIVALFWALDCFVGAALTFPPARPADSSDRWLQRWKPSWRLRWGKALTFVFTWHRATGLWLWAALFVFAWSSVSFNLRVVYAPVMRAVLGFEERADRVLPERRRKAPSLSWDEALARGRALMHEQALLHHLRVREESQLSFLAEKGAFAFRVSSDRDVAETSGATLVLFDAADGALLSFQAPTGEVPGNTLTTWFTQLHFGKVRGTGSALRIAVAATGIATALLAASGVWLWLKRRARNAAAHPPPTAANPTRDRTLAAVIRR